MSEATIEERLERLERIVEEMRRGLHRQSGQPGRDDWQSTIGAFADDPIADEIIDEALRLREDERQPVPLMIILDTDHISFLQRPRSLEAQRLVRRLAAIPTASLR